MNASKIKPRRKLKRLKGQGGPGRGQGRRPLSLDNPLKPRFMSLDDVTYDYFVMMAGGDPQARGKIVRGRSNGASKGARHVVACLLTGNMPTPIEGDN